ncbi:MAG: response regulator transcription factor [Gammaproteobacteria bacterium]|jgi:DNA-binding response OmpR family regulator
MDASAILWRILVMDDDSRICRLLARYLGREKFMVDTALSGAEMRQHMAANPANLVILDIKLPDEDGLGLVRYLCQASTAAIIILTEKADPMDKVVGLEMGADDYVTKPFDTRELLARIRSLLRRRTQRIPPPAHKHLLTAHFAGWALDLAGQQLISPAGEHIYLTRQEFQLLTTLVRKPHCVLTRDEILTVATGRDSYPYDRSVDVLVGRLRKKMVGNADDGWLIKTVRNVGYKLAANVQFASRQNLIF